MPSDNNNKWILKKQSGQRFDTQVYTEAEAKAKESTHNKLVESGQTEAKISGPVKAVRLLQE